MMPAPRHLGDLGAHHAQPCRLAGPVIPCQAGQDPRQTIRRHHPHRARTVATIPHGGGRSMAQPQSVEGEAAGEDQIDASPERTTSLPPPRPILQPLPIAGDDTDPPSLWFVASLATARGWQQSVNLTETFATSCSDEAFGERCRRLLIRRRISVKSDRQLGQQTPFDSAGQPAELRAGLRLLGSRGGRQLAKVRLAGRICVASGFSWCQRPASSDGRPPWRGRSSCAANEYGAQRRLHGGMHAVGDFVVCGRLAGSVR